MVIFGVWQSPKACLHLSGPSIFSLSLLLYTLSMYMKNINNSAHSAPICTSSVQEEHKPIEPTLLPSMLAVSRGNRNNGIHQHLHSQREFQQFPCHMASALVLKMSLLQSKSQSVLNYPTHSFLSVLQGRQFCALVALPFKLRNHICHRELQLFT